jgi:predicted N-acetyltransferase YhbS
MVTRDPPATTGDAAVPLAGGLLLRPSGRRDLEQIGELLAARGEPEDATDHRLVVEDPQAGWEACAVVVDGDRVVATATLLDERVHLGDVELPAGQVELVAAAHGYEGRGLVRALMSWAHARSEDRGHVLQVMVGIPYFYRLFGYEYAIDIPPALAVPEFQRGPGEQPPGADGWGRLRSACPSDLPALTELQDAAQAGFDVRMPHSPQRRRWLLEHEASTTWLLQRAGISVATARTPTCDDGVLVAEAAAVDAPAAEELLRQVAALSPEAPVRVVQRAGTVTGDAWRTMTVADPDRGAQQYYVRIPDAATLLDRIRPVLWNRLTVSGLDRAGGDVVLSTFRHHYRIPVGADGLGPVAAGGVMQAPGAARGAGVAPDQLAAVVFGAGLVALSRLRPDVYAGPDRELFDVLFPPVTADLLTYYLPY